MSASSKPPAPINHKEWLLAATQRLSAVDIPSARLDAELILCHVLQKDRTWLIGHTDEAPTAHMLSQADVFLDKRIRRIPLAYIVGYKEFYGRRFIVTPDVLIPRPETEVLIDQIKTSVNTTPARILDVGTGSGAIAITLAAELPQVTIEACDTSPTALAVARDNMSLIVPHRFILFKSDLLSHATGSYDYIVANLPYVDISWQRSPETNHEPHLALFAEENGLALIYRLISQAPQRLSDKGYLVLEADPTQHSSIIDYLRAYGLIVTAVDDYCLTLQKV